jgi:hypothetical protein
MKLVSRSFALVSLVGLLVAGCTLITDVDRSKISTGEEQAEGGSGSADETGGTQSTGGTESTGGEQGRAGSAGSAGSAGAAGAAGNG